MPALVITCSNDEKVPLESVENVYNNLASSYKELWITNGRRHFDSLFYNPEAYTYRVLRFIEKFLEKKFKDKKAHKLYADVPDALTLKIAATRSFVKKEVCLEDESSVDSEKESLDSEVFDEIA